MYRNRFEKSEFYPRPSNRSNAQAMVNVGVELIPDLYSDGICLYTVGPSQVYSYQYSIRKSSRKSYICEIFFYPKVLQRKYISAVVHYPAINNAKPHTFYKDLVCFVPRCLDHYQSKKVITEPLLEEVHKTGLYHQPKRRIREYTSSVHMAPKTIDNVWESFVHVT